MSSIHPSASVDPEAKLGEGVEIGAHASVGAGVRLADGVVLRPHAHVAGDTEIGRETVIYPFACVGEVPQDQKFQGEHTRLVIGERNQVREHVTIHPGTAVGGGVTTIGNDNLIMIGSHVGHDCTLGDHIIITNNSLLAGHVTMEDHSVLAANCGVQQFVRVGESAFVAGLGGVLLDLAPFTFAFGYPARVLKVNKINLERRGWDADRIAAVERAFRIIFRSKLKAEEAFAQVRSELPDSADAERMVSFLEQAERGFTRLR